MSKAFVAEVAGMARPIKVVDTPVEALEVAFYLRSLVGPMAFDTETTGLDIYGEDYRVRLVQLGTQDEAFVFVVEDRPEVMDVVREILRSRPALVAHNASFDIRTLRMPELWATTEDTYLLAHLLDPRGVEDGGTGHGLEMLSAAYFDEDAIQYKEALFTRFRELGFKKDSDGGWGTAYASVPITDDQYLRYAGVDVLLCSWLYSALRPLVVAGGYESLAEYENRLSKVCGGMMDRGMAVDIPYLEEIGPSFTVEAVKAEKVALSYGVDNVNSGAKVGAALEALGAPLEARTKTGKWKTDKEVLEGLVASGGPWTPLAEAVMVAKNANGFRTKYVDKVIEGVDAHGRVHADIRSLKARTARMAVANPPLQQLPSGDWKIRRGFVAAPGHVIVAADLDQVELRVLAVLAQEKKMIAAIRAGDDLHQITGDAAKVSRRVGKKANFLMVYGGGASKLARSAGIPLTEAKRVVAVYHRTFPGVKRFSRQIMDRAEMGRRSVVTPTGRSLPMDRDRVYAGLNYLVQSTARDVLGQALIRMEEEGLDRYLIMVVHDEVLMEVPAPMAEEVREKVRECMTFRNFLGSGVDLTAGADIYGASWGHGYGAPE